MARIDVELNIGVEHNYNLQTYLIQTSLSNLFFISKGKNTGKMR